MGNNLQQSNHASPVLAMDHEASADSPDRVPSVRSREGRILRHWTTNGLAFKGKTTTTPAMGDWGLAEARQRNLVASKLKSLAGGAGAP